MKKMKRKAEHHRKLYALRRTMKKMKTKHHQREVKKKAKRKTTSPSE
jgi:hypothetical protein